MKEFTLKLKPSYILASILTAIFSLADLAILYTYKNLYLIIFINLVGLAWFWRELKYLVLLTNQNSILKIDFFSDSSIFLYTKNNIFKKVFLENNSILSTHFVLLNFLVITEKEARHFLAKTKKRISVNIFSDSLDKEDFRKLRLWLNQAKHQQRKNQTKQNLFLNN